MSSAIISKSKFVIFLVHDTSARRRIQHQTLFYAGYIQPGTLHHIRVDGYIVNATLYEEFRKVGIYGRRLSTDGYGLAVSVRHFDQVAARLRSSKREATVSLFLSHPRISIVKSLEPME